MNKLMGMWRGQYSKILIVEFRCVYGCLLYNAFNFSLYSQNFILRSAKILNNLHHRTKEVDQLIIYQVIIVILGLA